MSLIGVDVDDTLYSFTSEARNVLARRAADTGDEQYMNAAYALWPEWRAPVDLLGLETWLDVIDEVHEDISILRQIPYPGASEALWKLVENGHELIYLSSRNLSCFDATNLWLQVARMPEGVLTCTGHDKTEWLSQCQYIIDDRPSTLVRFVHDFNWKNIKGSQRVAFGLITDYNRALTDVPNIFLSPNWNLMRRYFAKAGLITELVEV
jgi:hypothetical protein